MAISNSLFENLDNNLLIQITNQVFDDLRPRLCEDIFPERHFDYLRSVRVLTECDCEEINHKVTRRSKVSHFIDILKTKGSKSLQEFCNSLNQEKTQLHLLQLLIRTFMDKKALLKDQNVNEDEDHTYDDLPIPGGLGGPEIPNP